jgi:N-acetyl-anhydromuramyl-L-alanine amidase AmpD
MAKLTADPNNIHPSDDVVMHVRTNSSRHGDKPILIVLHDTEGANIRGIVDLKGLGTYFDRSLGTDRESSSHVATDAEGNSARFVADGLKAWHCAFYNSVSLGIEQIGFATQFGWPGAQQQETARWIARWAQEYKIPVRQGKVSLDGRVLTTGVVRHSDLGNLGGGHHDPGQGYPFADVLRLARGYLHLLEKA